MISFILGFSAPLVFANDDAAIASIRQAYEQAHNNLCKFKATEFDAGTNSSEGVEAQKRSAIKTGKLSSLKRLFMVKWVKIPANITIRIIN